MKQLHFLVFICYVKINFLDIVKFLDRNSSLSMDSTNLFHNFCCCFVVEVLIPDEVDEMRN